MSISTKFGEGNESFYKSRPFNSSKEFNQQYLIIAFANVFLTGIVSQVSVVTNGTNGTLVITPLPDIKFQTVTSLMSIC